ncbi:MAG: hypothetical protein LUI12_12785 [Clostridiales bacterium]|nr:hypothetical protein [Clostridiales bacterium]
MINDNFSGMRGLAVGCTALLILGLVGCNSNSSSDVLYGVTVPSETNQTNASQDLSNSTDGNTDSGEARKTVDGTSETEQDSSNFIDDYTDLVEVGEKVEDTSEEEQISLEFGQLDNTGTDFNNLVKSDGSIAFDDDYIYFYDYYGYASEERLISRVHFDGTGYERLGIDELYGRTGSSIYMNIKDGYLYWSSWWYAYRYCIDTGVQETLNTDELASYMVVIDNYLYIVGEYYDLKVIDLQTLDSLSILNANDYFYYTNLGTNYSVEVVSDGENIYLMGASKDRTSVVIITLDMEKINNYFEQTQLSENYIDNCIEITTGGEIYGDLYFAKNGFLVPVYNGSYFDYEMYTFKGTKLGSYANFTNDWNYSGIYRIGCWYIIDGNISFTTKNGLVICEDVNLKNPEIITLDGYTGYDNDSSLFQVGVYNGNLYVIQQTGQGSFSLITLNSQGDTSICDFQLEE